MKLPTYRVLLRRQDVQQGTGNSATLRKPAVYTLQATHLHVYGDQAGHEDNNQKLVTELGTSLQVDTPVPSEDPNVVMSEDSNRNVDNTHGSK